MRSNQFDLRQRAEKVIPLGCNTLSKSPNQWAYNAPTYLVAGYGPKVQDADGKWWLDATMGLGAVILGHGELIIGRAMAFPLSTVGSPLEVDVAELLCEMGGHDKVRLGKTGSDAVAAAVRCARIATGKNSALVDDGYHGWHDWFAATTERNRGIGPQATVKFGENRQGLDESGWLKPEKWGHLAAVVVEPDRHSEQDLKVMRGLCDYSDIYLIFDEVITGFRYPHPWPVKPDLTCYGKTLANGMAVSAVCGSDEAMRPFEHGFWSTTHANENVSLAAAQATLRRLQDGTLSKEINAKGEHLMECLADLGYNHHGYGARIVVDFDSTEHKTATLECLADRGILCNGNIFLSAAHSDVDVAEIAAAFSHATAWGPPRGRLVQAVYRSA
jgi:glutamate-1-semialdehyde aminotransferase